MMSMRQKAVRGLRAGDVFTVRRTFTETEMQTFGHLSRDYNPVHYERDFARSRGMEGPILHGLLVAGMLTEVGGQIGWLASQMDFRFRRPVYAGDTIECRVELTEVGKDGRARAGAVYVNQRGETVIEARLAGIVPGNDQRRVMAEMLAAGDPTNTRRGI